ncbi:hypothetical protein RND71_032782 [Anisodus tanguticus]|uniref:F-box domain-containing protein n=1 Tax=Anisodus tanguticus TaxID=243964 RepID=A0AAE1R7Z0_9SOLA|nr:hypothetical protein RND71_032782 [Anisodus tanguticus]
MGQRELGGLVRDAKVDYSELPDDVLSSIVARPTVRDAVRTSILSKRWRYLIASMPTLKFSLDMIGANSCRHKCFPHYQQKFLKVVNQFLQLYSGRKVSNLEMHICIGREFSSEFDQLMHSLSKIDGGHLEDILSSCLNLNQLGLKSCKLPYKLCISGTVKSVRFTNCGGLEEIDLQATNLRRDTAIPYIFGEFVRDLPAQIKSLTVTACYSQVKNFPTETQIFRNLRMLALLLENTYDFDMVKVSPVLDSCPLLRYLDLVQWGTFRQARGRGIRFPLSPTYHTELKEVRFGGFLGTGEEIEFASYIVRSAVLSGEKEAKGPYGCNFQPCWLESYLALSIICTDALNSPLIPFNLSR